MYKGRFDHFSEEYLSVKDIHLHFLQMPSLLYAKNYFGNNQVKHVTPDHNIVYKDDCKM